LHPRLQARIELLQERDPHIDRRAVENELGVAEVVGASLGAGDLIESGHVEREASPASLRSEDAVALERDVALAELERRRRPDAVSMAAAAAASAPPRRGPGFSTCAPSAATWS